MKEMEDILERYIKNRPKYFIFINVLAWNQYKAHILYTM